MSDDCDIEDDYDVEERWALADHISDEIVDMLHRAQQDARSTPFQLLAGVCLGLKGLLRTAAEVPNKPPAFVNLEEAVDRCLSELLATDRAAQARAKRR